MSDTALDELVSLYRKAARETSPTRADARILRLAARTGRHHLRGAWWWLGAAASFMALRLVMHVAEPHPTEAAAIGLETVLPGSTDGTASAYLLQMDITPAPTPVAQYLMSEAQTSR
jgi:hypothetical protein